MLWVGVHLPALSLESFVATLVPEQVHERRHDRVNEQVSEPRSGRGGSAQTPRDDVDEFDELDPIGPVALVERHRIVAVNAAARECGLAIGQKRATALALAPHARLGEADPARDAAALQVAVHVLMEFTPAVSLGDGHVVLAEVQSSLRYFGGLPRLIERLRAGLAPLRHTLRIACAPTPLGAQWMAVWRGRCALAGGLPGGLIGGLVGGSPGMPDGASHDIGSAAQWRACIGTLPVDLMAAAAPHLSALQTLGLLTVADLWKQPRAGLARRFGDPLLSDIDRALGELADPRTRLEPAPVFDSRLELFMRADDSAALLAGAAVLLHRLTAWARARHGRVGGFELRLHHETRLKTMTDPAARTTVLPIGLGEPVTDTAHLQALLRERLQRLPLAASVIELSLHCDAITSGAPPNAELFPSAASVGEGWTRLLERLEARLGANNLQRLAAVADHRPELATAVSGVSSRGAADRRVGGAGGNGVVGVVGRVGAGALLSLPGPCGSADALSGEPSHWPRLRRPTWLLTQPQPLREEGGTPLLAGRALWLVAGPERIQAGWWDGAVAARDYFIAQDGDGALLWIYRAMPVQVPVSQHSAWYLHGRFG